MQFPSSYEPEVKTKWGAQPTQLDVTDKITVRNLHGLVGSGVDVWGRERHQRALVTVTVSLAKPFDSAAESDALDNSTVHYGILSKAIQAKMQSGAGGSFTYAGAKEIRDAIQTVACDVPLTSTEIDIFYPKGSMFGDGAGFTLGTDYESAKMYHELYIRNVRVPCLIGINPNERLQKQPVVVNLWIDCVALERSNDYQKLETHVVDIISGSSFETLESLATTVIQQLREKFFTHAFDDPSFVRLRIEKPHAVPAADAPAIEIYRPVRP
ncbi:hypothetical protein N0V90_005250 [Kalmusia sp. IMI 367209]|nr:hypothetical protein N0V90_005250 [Kalmusia sp. IMI 367209]